MAKVYIKRFNIKGGNMLDKILNIFKRKYKCWNCGTIRINDFPIDEQGNKYCPDCNNNQ